MIQRNLKSFLIRTLFIMASIIVVSGCNTVEGLGKDLQQGGKALQKAADEKQTSKKQ